MKTILRALAAMWCIACANASNITLDGTLSWKISKPDCTFIVDGSIQNLGPAGTSSGTLMLVLWATPTPFPAKGYQLARFQIGQLQAGYQASDFKRKAPVEVPALTGPYYFTVSVLEYTTSGWLTRAYTTTGRETLDNGELVTGTKWLPPNKPVVAPPKVLSPGTKLILTARADGGLDAIKPNSHAKIQIVAKRSGKATLTISGDKSTWARKYSLIKSKLNDVSSPAAKLTLDDVAGPDYSTILFFYQNATSGVYRSKGSDPTGTGTFWGTFKQG